MRYLKDNYNEKAMEKKFTESYKIMCKLNEPFHEKMKKIYEYKSINNESEFMECTELGKGVYRKLVTKGYIPSMKTFMSMCMGLNLDLPTAESLLASLSLGFEKTDRLDCAYMFLLTHYQGLCIEDCNRILQKLGFKEAKELLGSFTWDEIHSIHKENEDSVT